MAIKGHLPTQLGCRLRPIVTKHVALGILGGKDEEFVIAEREAELLADIVVVRAGLVSCSTGAVKPGSGIDARGCGMAVVLARQGVAGAALGRARAMGCVVGFIRGWVWEAACHSQKDAC